MCVCRWLRYNQCGKNTGETRKNAVNEYYIQKLTQQLSIDGWWDKTPWQNIEPLIIDQNAGTKPAHFPRVQAKLAYDVAALYVIFEVEDRHHLFEANRILLW